MVGNVGNHLPVGVQQNAPVVKYQGAEIDTSYKASNAIMSGDELIAKMGAPPKADMTINFGLFGIKTLNARSNEYKETLSALADYQKVRGELGDQPVQFKNFSSAVASLQRVLDGCAKYIEKHESETGKAGRREVISELSTAITKELGNLEKVLDLVAVPAGQGLSMNAAMRLVEAGISNPAQVSATLSDANLVGQPIHFGAGQVNEVSLVKYQMPNGTIEERVLKPLHNCVPLFVGKEAGIGIALEDTRFGARNLASAVVADALGFGSMIPKPDIVEHDGKICLAMPKAPGQEFLGSAQIVASPDMAQIFTDEENDVRNGGQDTGNIQMFQASRNDEGIWVQKKSVANDFPLVVGDRPQLTANLQKGLLDLQVVDLLSGQIDRHAHNFFVRVEGSAVVITGIDNDTAFGSRQTGIKLPYFDAVNADPPFAGPPPLMSRGAYQGLQNIDRETYSASLKRCGLNDDEVSAAISRLDAMVEHAQALETSDRIVDDFATWKGIDPKSNKEMNASDFIVASQSNSYVLASYSASQKAVQSGLPIVPLDPVLHDLQAISV